MVIVFTSVDSGPINLQLNELSTDPTRISNTVVSVMEAVFKRRSLNLKCWDAVIFVHFSYRNRWRIQTIWVKYNRNYQIANIYLKIQYKKTAQGKVKRQTD